MSGLNSRATFARALSGFGALTDARTGVIRKVEVLKTGENDPAIYLAHAEPCDTTALAGLPAANRGAACSATPERAIVRACGESVERYCSAFFDVGSMLLTSPAELAAAGTRHVRVEEIYPYAKWQYEQPGFKFEQPSADRQLRFVPGASLMTGEQVWLPASCVYVPYLFDAAVEPFTHMPISTGLAAGPNVDACIHKGIMEIMERDALMITWYGRLPAPRIPTASCYGLSPEIDYLLDQTQATGGDWFINWLTLDVNVPVISVALIDPGQPPLTSFGIAADPDAAHALLLAIEEALLTRMLLNRSRELIDDPQYIQRELNTLRDHLLAHATSPNLRDELRFLTAEAPNRTFQECVETLTGAPRDMRARLMDAGLEAIWIDVTTPDVAECGFRVVRTVVPGMQPLDNDHHRRYLGGARLRTVPERLGYGPRTLESFNPEPHPFP